MSADTQEVRAVTAAQRRALEPATLPAARPGAAASPVMPVLPQPAAARAPSALARAQAAAGQLVPRLQYLVARVGVAGQVGVAALAEAVAVAIGVLLPAYHAMHALSADVAAAQVTPGGYSVEQAVPRLMASLPTRGQIPAVLGEIYAQAKAAGVPLDTGRYVFTPAKGGQVARYDLEFPVKGAGYPALRTFINRTLNAVPAASVGKLQVERKAVADQAVSADIAFVVFVRGEDAP